MAMRRAGRRFRWRLEVFGDASGRARAPGCGCARDRVDAEAARLRKRLICWSFARLAGPVCRCADRSTGGEARAIERTIRQADGLRRSSALVARGPRRARARARSPAHEQAERALALAVVARRRGKRRRSSATAASSSSSPSPLAERRRDRASGATPTRQQAALDPLGAPGVERAAVLGEAPRVARVVEVALRASSATAASIGRRLDALAARGAGAPRPPCGRAGRGSGRRGRARAGAALGSERPGERPRRPGVGRDAACVDGRARGLGSASGASGAALDVALDRRHEVAVDAERLVDLGLDLLARSRGARRGRPWRCCGPGRGARRRRRRTSPTS